MSRREARQERGCLQPAERNARIPAVTHGDAVSVTETEVDTMPLVLKCFQAGKTVAVPTVSWDQRRMLPVEITSLQTGMTTSGHGIREPVGCKPVPVEFIDLVIVPGIGFTRTGFRIGRGMGFYDRFLSLPDFAGITAAWHLRNRSSPSSRCKITMLPCR